MLRNCINCGKVHTLPAKMCKECREKEQKLYQKVREFLWKNPNSTVDEIHEKTGVSKKKIIKYVKEGRFEVTAGSVNTEVEQEKKSNDS